MDSGIPHAIKSRTLVYTGEHVNATSNGLAPWRDDLTPANLLGDQ